MLPVIPDCMIGECQGEAVRLNQTSHIGCGMYTYTFMSDIRGRTGEYADTPAVRGILLNKQPWRGKFLTYKPAGSKTISTSVRMYELIVVDTNSQISTSS